jgi:formylglycine-generating enzyme required for sulfatase activity
VTVSAWHRPLPSEDEKEQLARRQANAATVLLEAGQAERLWPLLRHRPDPRVRSRLIHVIKPGTDLTPLVKRLSQEPDVSARRALLLALGQHGLARRETRDAALACALELYRTDPDPGVHAAAEWLLRRADDGDKLTAMEQSWAKDREGRESRLRQIKDELSRADTRAGWYVNSQGQTMAVVPGPVEFIMGATPEDAVRDGLPPEFGRQRMRIPVPYAIAAKDVTVAQYLRFRPSHAYNKVTSPHLDCPVNLVRWYDAAAYCNWLSQQEGIPERQWCYQPNDRRQYEEGMTLAPDYLQRTGYRLASEVEWEYACRAGATTSRYYGEADDLLGEYAWYSKNTQDRSMQPVGRLKPNDLGLFDMLGNAEQWCQPATFLATDGIENKARYTVRGDLPVRLRGAGFNRIAGELRAGYAAGVYPYAFRADASFRVARTIRCD